MGQKPSRVSPRSYASAVRFYRDQALWSLVFDAVFGGLCCLMHSHVKHVHGRHLLSLAAALVCVVCCLHVYHNVALIRQQWLGLYVPIHTNADWLALAPKLVDLGFRGVEDMRELADAEVAALQPQMTMRNLGWWNCAVSENASGQYIGRRSDYSGLY